VITFNVVIGDNHKLPPYTRVTACPAKVLLAYEDDELADDHETSTEGETKEDDKLNKNPIKAKNYNQGWKVSEVGNGGAGRWWKSKNLNELEDIFHLNSLAPMPSTEESDDDDDKNFDGDKTKHKKNIFPLKSFIVKFRNKLEILFNIIIMWIQ